MFVSEDLIWSDDIDVLQSTFFWWEEEEEESPPGDEDSTSPLGSEDEDSIQISTQEIITEFGESTGPTNAIDSFTQFGPGDEAAKSIITFDKNISTFILRLPTGESSKPEPYGIHGRKAAVALIAYPHKLLEQKKTRKCDPSVYAVVDSFSSYYPDKGVFLNMFASTCEKLKIETWRAEKLVDNFNCRKKNIHYYGSSNKCDWARNAGISLGASVIFVGDGCCGRIGPGVWTEEDLIQFKRSYNPIWVSFFPEGKHCGCQTTIMAKYYGWKMYHGIKNSSDLRNIDTRTQR